jgi:hypothetical protein
MAIANDFFTITAMPSHLAAHEHVQKPFYMAIAMLAELK